jgi:uncharacterized cupin superfamily protein
MVFSAEHMPPWPLAPERVLEGRPHARGRWLGASRDRGTRGGVWEFDEGRFELAVEGDAVVLVLEGCLIAQTGHGETLTLDAGDVARLPAGLDCVCTVPRFCRCAFVESEPGSATVGDQLQG